MDETQYLLAYSITMIFRKMSYKSVYLETEKYQFLISQRNFERKYIFQCLIEFLMRKTIRNIFLYIRNYTEKYLYFLVGLLLRFIIVKYGYISYSMNFFVLMSDYFTADMISNIYWFFADFFLLLHHNNPIFLKKDFIPKFTLWNLSNT